MVAITLTARGQFIYRGNADLCTAIVGRRNEEIEGRRVEQPESGEELLSRVLRRKHDKNRGAPGALADASVTQGADFFDQARNQRAVEGAALPGGKTLAGETTVLIEVFG